MTLLWEFHYKDKRDSDSWLSSIPSGKLRLTQYTVLGAAWRVQAAITLQQSLPPQNDFSGIGGVYSGSGWKTHSGCFCIQTKTNTVEPYTVKSTSWLWRTRAQVFNLLVIPQWHSQERTQKSWKVHWNHRHLTAGWLGYEDFSREHGITDLAQGYPNM